MKLHHKVLFCAYQDVLSNSISLYNILSEDLTFLMFINHKSHIHNHNNNYHIILFIINDLTWLEMLAPGGEPLDCSWLVCPVTLLSCVSLLDVFRFLWVDGSSLSSVLNKRDNGYGSHRNRFLLPFTFFFLPSMTLEIQSNGKKVCNIQLLITRRHCGMTWCTTSHHKVMAENAGLVETEESEYERARFLDIGKRILRP